MPRAKAVSGLTEQETCPLDRVGRGNSFEKFGPVRGVKPLLVFELAFVNAKHSNRHKSEIVVRFPRRARGWTDRSPSEADSLESVKALLSTDSSIEPSWVRDFCCRAGSLRTLDLSEQREGCLISSSSTRHARSFPRRHPSPSAIHPSRQRRLRVAPKRLRPW